MHETHPEEESCSIFSLVQCLKDTAYLISYTLGLAAQPFIQLIQYLMTKPPNTEVFKTAWLFIISIISIFYIFFLLYSGITFIISIITYGSSLLVTAPIFENFTILFYIVAFLIILTLAFIYLLSLH